MNRYEKVWHLMLVVLIGGGLVFPLTASAYVTSDCEEAVVEAEEHYVDRAFSETVRLLSDCYYREDLPPELSVEIVRLVALAHLGNDDLELARRAVLRILSFDAGYEADPVQDPPNYASMVSIVRQQVHSGELHVPQLASEPRQNRDWLYVMGAGVLTVAVTAAIAVMSDSNGRGGIETQVGLPGGR